MPNKINKVVIYGKGGIGKSTISSNLSMAFAKSKLRVLQIGCDPKHDSTISLLRAGKIRTVMDVALKKEKKDITRNDIVVTGINNIDCIECGGPKAGVGCAGRGISLMFEIMTDLGIINSGSYDAIIYDVLGDVVCGGFAAPLKLNFGEKVFIVVSEEISSLFAANNIAHGIKQYEYNGIYLAGLILNLRDNNADLEHVRKFARKLNTKIIATIPRSAEISKAEHSYKTLMELYPDSKMAREFSLLANEVLVSSKSANKKLHPLDEKEFSALFKKAKR
jgi:nitrogenase iron protein NifH